MERRRYRRYIVAGSVRFVMNFGAGSTELVNLGEGGMLIRAAAVLADGATGTFHVVPSRYPLEFEVEGQVVGGKDDLVAIQFPQKHHAVSALIQRLEQENCPWTGTIPDASTSGCSPRTESKTLEHEAQIPELESAWRKG
ncbi:MAG: PilZ domain-containing protein [Terriglobia bacterium]